VCGNSVVEAGETCDPPGNPVPPNNNPCRDDCTYCGDGVTQPGDGESCDDGNSVSGCRPDLPQKPLDACLNSCQEPICDDPSKITLNTDKLDVVKAHGRLIVATQTDLDFGGTFTFRLSRRLCSNDASLSTCSTNASCGPGSVCTNLACSHDASVLCGTSQDCAALSSGSTCSEISPDSIVFEQVLSAGSVVEGNPAKWRYRNLGAKTAGGIYVMKITGKPLRSCAAGPNDGAACTSPNQCPGGSCVGYYALKLKAFGDMQNAVADMETQVLAGTKKWAVRGMWQPLSKGWKLDKKSQFLDPYP
jgi:hypothetical protein